MPTAEVRNAAIEGMQARMANAIDDPDYGTSHSEGTKR
jgi:hypothetical protein